MVQSKLPRRSKKRTVINVSELPSSCYEDGSLCGDFLTEFCPLKEVLNHGGVILRC